MTQLERDLHLQELILEGDTTRVKEFYNKRKIRRPLSRALGYACRYSTPEIVQMLVDGGATFSYYRRSARVNTNGIAGPTPLDDAIETYLYFLNTDDCRAVAAGNRLRETDEIARRTTGDAYDEIVRILAASADETDFDPSSFLFFAVLYDNKDALRALRKAGVTQITGMLQRVLSDETIAKGASRFKPYLGALDARLADLLSEPERLNAMLAELVDLVGVPIRVRVYPGYGSSGEMASEEASLALVKHTTLAKHRGKRRVLEDCIRHGYVQLLSWALDQGWARAWSDYEYLKEVAAKTEAPEEFCALILEKQRASGKSQPKQRSMDPLAAVNLRRIWSTKIQSDGTLKIVSYKGTDNPEEGVVVVPDHIGKQTVTAVDAGAFSRYMVSSDKIRAARASITDITLPGTIREIPDRFLRGHQELEKVVVSEGTTAIGDEAFSMCPNLREVVLPGSLKTIERAAFIECPSLERVDVPQPSKLADKVYRQARTVSPVRW